MTVSFILNGNRVEARDFEPHVTLLEYLRRTGLTGTKEGCAEGECGACAVVLVQENAKGEPEYRPVNSCLLLLSTVADHEVLSVEGVARHGLHPVQEAMVKEGGSQCGYCTPGFVISLFAEYYRPDRAGYDPESISGNLCRCTGYRPIRDVARNLGKPDAEDPFKRRLALAPPGVRDLTAPGFERPTRLRHVFELMPGATLIAGGTDLVVEMNQRHRRFERLVSLENVAELRGMEWSDSMLTIGAGVTLSEIERQVHGRVPLLEQLFPLFSSRLIRNRATLGGNLMTASPIGDSPPALLALDAEVELTHASASRWVPLSDFFVSYRKTRIENGELLSRVRIPLPLPKLQRFYKVSKRLLDDISTVAAGFSLRFRKDGVIDAARLAYGGVAATPVRVKDAERALEGQQPSREILKRTLEVLGGSVQPLSDHRGSAEYRARMVPKLFEKFWIEVVEGST